MRAGKTLRVTIATASMTPTLAPGDHILVRGARADELRVGDIALLRAGEMYVAHRLLARRGAQWIAKGDHVARADPSWAPAQVCGVVVARQTGARTAPRSCRMAMLNRWLARLSQIEIWTGRIHSRRLRHAAAKLARGGLRLAALGARRWAREVSA